MKDKILLVLVGIPLSIMTLVLVTIVTVPYAIVWYLKAFGFGPPVIEPKRPQ